MGAAALGVCAGDRPLVDCQRCAARQDGPEAGVVRLVTLLLLVPGAAVAYVFLVRNATRTPSP